MKELEQLKVTCVRFVEHTENQLKLNPKYRPHALIQAFDLAMSEAAQNGSGSATVGEDGEQYLVTLEQKDGSLMIKEMKETTENVDLGLDLLTGLMNLQMSLDEKGEKVSVNQAVDTLNECFESPSFVSVSEKEYLQIKEKFLEYLKTSPNGFVVNRESRRIIEKRAWSDLPSNIKKMAGIFYSNEKGLKSSLSIVGSKLKPMTKDSILSTAKKTYIAQRKNGSTVKFK